MISNQYTDQNQLYIALGYCAFMLLLGWLLKKFPPKKINHLYGYRTQRSMKNQATWEAANTYSSLVFFKVSLYSFFIPVALYFLYPQQNVLFTIITNTLLLLYVLYATEKHLKARFDIQGNPLD
ncbi:SdpI family protein [Flavobacteriaceae bacterium]|jgi:uncharacterized membrane protein|nr:SdpI family protein [Flavobacteriaceae bacterium]MDC1416386.1 SdpI family protein [Flavobacteriaceae bacterium]